MRRAGFTLIEVLVAIMIASMVVIAAHRLFTGVADGAKAVADARAVLDRSANGRRWLKAAFLSLDPPFEGRAHRVSFNSWQLTPGDWFERDAVVVAQESGALVATTPAGRLDLADAVSGLTFDYLLEPGADTKWVAEWISPVSAPVAIRLRIAGCGKSDAGCVDTLLFLVRERG